MQGHNGIRSSLRFRGSRPGLFCNLSAGDSCPLRILPLPRELRFPPLISCEKHSGLPPVTAEKTLSLLKNCSVNPKGIFSLNIEMDLN